MGTTTLHERLTDTWRYPQTLGFITAVDHKTIGLRWIVTSIIFFLMAGVLALTMLIQLSRPANDFLSAEAYNQFFTMHGMTMMFFFGVPIGLGLGIYFVPLMIGARDLPFPRLNAFGYWVYLFSGIGLWISLLLGSAPDAGWFNYTPLSGPVYSPEINVDFYALSIASLEFANLVAAAILIVGIFKMRAPGMSINRMPMFVWSILVTSWMVIFAMPPLMLATIFLALDRLTGTHFFNTTGGGSPVLWQHLFWFFGHPEVYIIVLPAFGVATMVVPMFARRPLIGYLPVVLANVAVGFVSFGLWVHHMFAGEHTLLGMSFFAAASMSIAIPNGVQVFAWIATLWHGVKIVWSTALLYVVGFIITFVIGGITGVMVSSIPFDWQVHDSHFVTAHFHYVLVGGAVFPLVAGLYYWFPKITGRMMSEQLGKISFWLVFIGFNAAFFTMHITGFHGMPRRVYTYLPGREWEGFMIITVIGGFILATGFVLTVINVILSLNRGEPAGNNPWEAGTLEWATESPPASYNFSAIPTVRDRNPIWNPVSDEEQVQYELAPDWRETMGTSTLDGEPQQIVRVAGPSYWPLVLALGVIIAFFGAIFSLIMVPVGSLLSFIAIVGWNWPRTERVV
jgi:cytochrome c oxidase subunit I+III